MSKNPFIVRIPSPCQPNDVDEAMPVKMMEELDKKKANMERTARAMKRQEMKAKRSQQKQQIPFISGGNYKDDCKVEGKLEDENEEVYFYYF
jgi:queuine/archaeosine tRNA-ribosyltransferase